MSDGTTVTKLVIETYTKGNMEVVFRSSEALPIWITDWDCRDGGTDEEDPASRLFLTAHEASHLYTLLGRALISYDIFTEKAECDK